MEIEIEIMIGIYLFNSCFVFLNSIFELQNCPTLRFSDHFLCNSAGNTSDCSVSVDRLSTNHRNHWWRWNPVLPQYQELQVVIHQLLPTVSESGAAVLLVTSSLGTETFAAEALAGRPSAGTKIMKIESMNNVSDTIRQGQIHEFVPHYPAY